MPVTRAHEGYALHQPVYSKSFDDSEPYISTNKLTNRYRGMPENNLLKSFSGDKERANNVAKIKVVVCLLKPLNAYINLYYVAYCEFYMMKTESCFFKVMKIEMSMSNAGAQETIEQKGNSKERGGHYHHTTTCQLSYCS